MWSAKPKKHLEIQGNHVSLKMRTLIYDASVTHENEELWNKSGGSRPTCVSQDRCIIKKYTPEKHQNSCFPYLTGVIKSVPKYLQVYKTLLVQKYRRHSWLAGSAALPRGNLLAGSRTNRGPRPSWSDVELIRIFLVRIQNVKRKIHRKHILRVACVQRIAT